jgi:SPP1 family predicted phage head-tail adaptor
MTKFQIKPGEFRHVITFQKKAMTQNSFGEVIVSDDEWMDVKTVRAGIYPISGSEFFAAETYNSEVSHKVNLRYIPGITPDMRVQFKDRAFRIISIVNFQERNIMLQLLCKELI